MLEIFKEFTTTTKINLGVYMLWHESFFNWQSDERNDVYYLETDNQDSNIYFEKIDKIITNDYEPYDDYKHSLDSPTGFIINLSSYEFNRNPQRYGYNLLFNWHHCRIYKLDSDKYEVYVITDDHNKLIKCINSSSHYFYTDYTNIERSFITSSFFKMLEAIPKGIKRYRNVKYLPKNNYKLHVWGREDEKGTEILGFGVTK